jgi:2-amino-4-hydroxy-6-hydroxymethyldihydropteridine diphosphokinase
VTRVALALGSNLGDRAANLRAALAALSAEGVAVIRASSVWESEPVPSNQPAFLNAAALVDTALAPAALLAACKRIERTLGRRPGPRWGPRPIDLDIIAIEGVGEDSEVLTVPHPRWRERGFVLAPLAEVVPADWEFSAEVSAAAATADLAGVRRTGLRIGGARPQSSR